jgi:NADH:ubiquinone oxidoreductase subunit E
MCVAACDRAPVAQMNLEYLEHLDPAKFDAITERLRNQAESAAGKSAEEP